MGSSVSFGFKKSVTPKAFAAPEGQNINKPGKLFIISLGKLFRFSTFYKKSDVIPFSYFSCIVSTPII